MVKIVLDIGHGGRDPGAVHYTEDDLMVTENEVVSQIAVEALMLLSRSLGEENIGYIAADNESMTLATRAKKIAHFLNNDFSLVVSLHMNKSSDTSSTGAECFYYDGNKKSKDKAKWLIKMYSELTGLRNRGAKPDKSIFPTGLAIMRKIDVTNTLRQDRVLLLECGFLSNDEDVRTVRSKAPYAIAKAVMAALGEENWHIPVDPTPVFADVPFSHFAHDAIIRMKDEGILEGYGDGLFRPDQQMTRAEVAIALDRMHKKLSVQ